MCCNVMTKLKNVNKIKLPISEEDHPYHLGLYKIAYDLFSDLPNIHSNFHKNWSSRFGGVR